MATRYFKYKDAKSEKFWEVSVTGKKVSIHYAEVPASGTAEDTADVGLCGCLIWQTSLKELSTPAEAKAYAEKQAAGKVEKGHTEYEGKENRYLKVAKNIAKYDPEQNEADYVCSVLWKIINGELDSFKESGQFKVRPGYSYDKFYLDRVRGAPGMGSVGADDMSLAGLIHHIMFQDGIYKKILTDEQYENCKKTVEEEPESIWGGDVMSPDYWCLQPSGLSPDDDYEQAGEIGELLAEIYNTCILYVHEILSKEGFRLGELEKWCGLTGAELGVAPTADEVEAYLAQVRATRWA